MKLLLAILVATALLVSGCASQCETERAQVDGLRALAATLEGDAREVADAEVEAAQAALDDCDESEDADGEWCREIALLFMKVLLEVVETR